eukprot:TRINITY_DN3514_c0_g1_i1.p1 TRINITY_DN3514_c0_g1~~TRINITY_DN3514_c0_g1_i1.p1  ORF type:complete len:215 (-),score=86.16 TRINITY_DN3514_c0_g1_i1:119-763(-)
MRLFGKAKKEPTAKDTIPKMREYLEVLEKRENYLQSKVDHEHSEARRYNSLKNKRAAIMCLKKKKAYEKQIESLGNARLTLEQQVMTIESASVNLETYRVMQQGSQTLAGIHKKIKPEDVDKAMEDMQEQMDLASDITQAISQGSGEVYDDDELLAELDALEQEDLDATLLNISAGPFQEPSHPQVKAKVTVQAQPVAEDEDEEFRALERSMMV